MDLKTCEIDAKLLEQLSALGTTDKDELIKQLKAVLGVDLSNESSRFFLELAGWNLQKAIGAYFDFGFDDGAPSSGVTANLTSHEISTVSNLNMFDVSVSPTVVEKSYPVDQIFVKITNCGTSPWPIGTYLRSEDNCSVAYLCTKSWDLNTPHWLPLGNNFKLHISSILPTESLEISIAVDHPTTHEFSERVIGALSFFLPDGTRFGEVLYCTAILDHSINKWMYYAGLVEPIQTSRQCSPMLTDNL